MTRTGHAAILVTSFPGSPSVAELARLAASGQGPRKDYVELARRLDAEVIDADFIARHGLPFSRLAARRLNMPVAQVFEVFLKQRRYSTIVAWADRLGLPLAVLLKLAGGRRDLVLVSAWASRGRKSIFLKQLRVHSHIKSMVNNSSAQLEIAATRLGVPREKLHLLLQPVDERFWRPGSDQLEAQLCAVGWEARDYPTLVEAMRGLDLKARLRTGSIVMPAIDDPSNPPSSQLRATVGDGLPPNVELLPQLDPLALRQLYARSRFAVVPIQNVEYDAGVTAIAEAMAMGKAVIASRTRGQLDLIEDGVQGILVPPGDPAALRSAIEYLASHPDEAERMGRAGRELVERRHTLDAYVDRLAALTLTTGSSPRAAVHAQPALTASGAWD